MIQGVLALIIAHIIGGSPTFDHREQPQPVQGCVSAVVRLKSPGRIGVTATCTGSHRAPDVVVMVALYPLGPSGEGEGIRGFRRHPRLAGSALHSHFGSCRRVGSAVRCNGKADGHVRLLVLLRVDARASCRQGFSVSTYEGGECGSGACPLSAVVHILAKERPRGC